MTVPVMLRTKQQPNPDCGRRGQVVGLTVVARGSVVDLRLGNHICGLVVNGLNVSPLLIGRLGIGLLLIGRFRISHSSGLLCHLRGRTHGTDLKL